DLIKKLVRDGHDVFLFGFFLSNDDYKKTLELGATPVHYSFSRAGLNPLHDIKDTFSLANQIKAIKPDLVFSYFAKPVVFGTLAAKFAGVPRRIAMLEGLGFAFTEQPNGLPFKTKLIRAVQVLLYRLAFAFLDRIIFLN